MKGGLIARAIESHRMNQWWVKCHEGPRCTMYEHAYCQLVCKVWIVRIIYIYIMINIRNDHITSAKPTRGLMDTPMAYGPFHSIRMQRHHCSRRTWLGLGIWPKFLLAAAMLPQLGHQHPEHKAAHQQMDANGRFRMFQKVSTALLILGRQQQAE